MIPWASPLAQYQAAREEIDGAIARVCESGTYILGPEVAAFESAFASYCGVAHAVGVGNGTDALILTMRAMDIGVGDEVITVSHTAVATTAAVIAVGATPVLVDVDPVFWTIDPAKIERAVSRKTRAIIPVHLYGQAADMSAILELAKRHNLNVIEDCAQAAGGRYGMARLGAIGNAGCFSFYPTKNLGGIGDGGAVVTNDPALARRLRELRQYGWNEARESVAIGVNSRLDPLQAAILGVKLSKLDACNARRATIAHQYSTGLAELPLQLPAQRPDTQHVYHLYVVAAPDRADFIAALEHGAIGHGIHYATPTHLQHGYTERVVTPPDGLLVTTGLVSRIVSLPMYPELSDSDVDQVVETVRSHYSKSPPVP